MKRFQCVVLVIVLVAFAGLVKSETGQGARSVAAAYLDAMESSDLGAAGALFASSSSVYESGGQEGDWQHYVEHHIGPELGQIKSFVIKRGEPEVQESQDQSMAFVAWPIEYRITLQDQRVIESKGTVTFVLVGDEKGFRIRHLHWSSRRTNSSND